MMQLDTLKIIQTNFLEELKDANKGKPTSLPFIVNELPSSPLVQQGESFAVLVIGGSVFKKAVVKKNSNSLIVEHFEEKQQPPFKTVDDLFPFIAQELPDEASIVAINFAYPLTPVFEDGRLDGILVSGSKENVFDGLVGKRICQEFERYIQANHQRTIKASIANDTVCLLLSGLITHQWNNLAGGIVGTGMNFAIFQEKNKVVNLEAANFDKFPQTDEGKEIDRTSAQPGKALFEKETSGAYLYKHFNLIVEKQNLTISPISSTHELKKIAIDKTSSGNDIAQMLVDRSAALVSAQIGAITLFYNCNMVFVMEGSFFWEEDIYRHAVERYIKQLIPRYTIAFSKVENSPILGGAKLVA